MEESQRERLLRAIAREAARNGYAGMSVADVIAAAGVSRRTFYEQFRDKEECFLVAFDVAFGQLRRAVDAAYEAGDTWREKVRAALRAYLDYLSREPDFARMCLVEVLAAGPKAMARRDAAMEYFRALFDEGRAEAPPGLAPSPLAAETTVGGIYEVVYARIVRGQVDQLPALEPELLYCALAPFVGQEEAARELTR